MDSITLEEEDLIELVKSRREDLKDKEIEIKERNLTSDGGIRLYFEVK